LFAFPSVCLPQYFSVFEQQSKSTTVIFLLQTLFKLLICIKKMILHIDVVFFQFFLVCLSATLGPCHFPKSET
jgi:hypothetical protein